MLTPAFMRQIEQIQKSFVFTSEFQRQLEQAAQIHRQIDNIASSVRGLTSFIHIPSFDFSYLAAAQSATARIQVPNIDTSQFLDAVNVANQIAEIVRPTLEWRMHFAEQLSQITSQYADVVKILAVDMAAFNLAQQLLPLSDMFRTLAKLGESKVMADAFTSADWSVAPSMTSQLKQRVLELYQGGKSRYISNAIRGYYHRNNFENLLAMVESWREHPIFAPRMHIIDDAVTAHQNELYTLSVPTLLPQIEGILTEYVTIHNLNVRCGKIEKVYKAVLGEADDYAFPTRAAASTILYQLQNNTYVYTNFEKEMKKARQYRQVSRHTVSHGVSTNYHTSVTSLRILVLLDAISALHSQISLNHKPSSTQ